MNLKKILRNGLMTIGLSTLALAPLTAEDPISLIKKCDPTTLMAISGGRHKDGLPIMALHYDIDSDGVEDSTVVYNFVNIPNGTTIVNLKEYYHDLNKDGQFDKDEMFIPETSYDRNLSIKDPIDFLKQLDPRYLVSIGGEEESSKIIFHYNLDEGKESGKVFYKFDFMSINKTMFVKTLEYHLDLNGNGEYSEDEKFLVEEKNPLMRNQL